MLHTSYCQSLKGFPFLWRVDFVDKESYSYLRAAGVNFTLKSIACVYFQEMYVMSFSDIPFKFLVDLITEAYNIFPVLLPVCWMSGFICQTNTFASI